MSLLAAVLSTVALVSAPCPEAPAAAGCTRFLDGKAKAVYIDPADTYKLPVLYHEAGHVFSASLTEDQRRPLIAARGWSEWREERFADAFASCFLTRQQRRKARAWYVSTGKRYPALCGLLDALTAVGTGQPEQA